MSNYKALLQEVDTFIFDYDGVMTDGKVILMEDGQPLRMANVKDGYVLQLIIKLGFGNLMALVVLKPWKINPFNFWMFF